MTPILSLSSPRFRLSARGVFEIFTLILPPACLTNAFLEKKLHHGAGIKSQARTAKGMQNGPISSFCIPAWDAKLICWRLCSRLSEWDGLMRAIQIIDHGSFPVRRSRWPRRLFYGSLLLVIAAAAGPCLYYILANNQLQEAITEADRLDPGWQFYELESKRAEIPDEQNSAILLMLAQRLMPAKWPYWASGKDPDNANRSADELSDLQNSFDKLQPQAQLSAQQIKELERELKRAAASLAEARRVKDMPRGRYPITYSPDFISTLLPHTQNARGLANLLAFDVRLRAQNKDLDGALESCRALLNTGRSVGDEPFFVSMLVRIAVDQIAVRKIERVLAQGQASEKALAELQKLIEQEAAEPLFLNAARGERAMMDGLLQAIKSGLVPINQLKGLVGGGGKPGDFESLELWLPGALKQSRAALLRYNTQLVEIARRPGEEQRAQIKQLLVSSADLPWLARLLSSSPRVAEAYHRNLASLRCALVMVASERYRLAHGRWPKEIGELVPDYLGQVPLDPYDGAHLRLRPLPDGLVIYSVSIDGQDNGGRLDDRPDQQGTDWGVRLWDVEKRRQPPRAVPPDGQD
jgi:hypothetical protein